MNKKYFKPTLTVLCACTAFVSINIVPSVLTATINVRATGISEKEQEIIVFNDVEGNVIKEVASGAISEEDCPEAPKLEGLTFMYWANQKGERTLKDSPLHPVYKYSSVKAEEGSCVVTFISGKGTPISHVSVEKGKTVPKDAFPGIPELELPGYDFDHWENIETGTPFYDITAVNEDIIVQARYREHPVPLPDDGCRLFVFNDIEGNEIKSVVTGSISEEDCPEAPKIEGLEFMYWANQEGEKTLEDSPLHPVYKYSGVKAEEGSCIVTFISRKGTPFSYVSVEKGKTVPNKDFPKVPEINCPGYMFDYWEDTKSSAHFHDNYVVNEDLVIQAKYESAERGLKVSFLSNRIVVPKTISKKLAFKLFNNDGEIFPEPEKIRFSIKKTAKFEKTNLKETGIVSIENDGTVTGLHSGIVEVSVIYNGHELADKAVIIVPGDANRDGKITISDAAISATYLRMPDAAMDDYTKELIDANGDGKHNISDITLIAQEIAGK